MKSKIVVERLNFEYPVQALRALSSQNCTLEGFDPTDLSRDANLWRSNTTEQIDLYFEISEADQLDTFVLLNTNLSTKAYVYISGSNTSGVAGFMSPTFSAQLKRKENNWIFHGSPQASSRYYKITIVENNPLTTYIQCGKVILGKSQDFPFEIQDGWSDEKESFQKRDLTNGQWTAGSEDSKINTYSFTCREANSLRSDLNNEYDLIKDTLDLYETLKGTNPFIFIYDPRNPVDLFDYVVMDGDQLEFYSGDGETIVFTLNLKETR